MRNIDRQEAIDKIVKDELVKWIEQFKEQNYVYFEDLILNGSGLLIGVEEMFNENLAFEYKQRFDEEVFIC